MLRHQGHTLRVNDVSEVGLHKVKRGMKEENKEKMVTVDVQLLPLIT